MNALEFANYCWGFYGPKGIYGEFFDHKLTLGQLANAVQLRMKAPAFEGDSIDREIVRDILLTSLGKAKGA